MLPGVLAWVWVTLVGSVDVLESLVVGGVGPTVITLAADVEQPPAFVTV